MNLIYKLTGGVILILSFTAILYFRKTNLHAAMWATVAFAVTLGELI
jgi:hypothetical protein